MPQIPSYLLFLLLIFVIVEATQATLKRDNFYDLSDALTNIFMFVCGAILRPITVVWTFFLFSVLEPFKILDIENSLSSFFLGLIVVDFVYYWYHRVSHKVGFFWTMHHTHHSSLWMNFTIAFRLNWLARFITPIFFLPLIVVGFSAELVTGALLLNLFFQFFLHNTQCKPMGKFEGMLLNTPSAHRVHHGSNNQYIDKNFAGIFIVWDRLFATYQAETEPVSYGVTSGFVGYNPIKIQFLSLYQWLTNRLTIEYKSAKIKENNAVNKGIESK